MIHIYTYIYVYIYRMQEYQKVAMSWNKLYIPEKCICQYMYICVQGHALCVHSQSTSSSTTLTPPANDNSAETASSSSNTPPAMLRRYGRGPQFVLNVDVIILHLEFCKALHQDCLNLCQSGCCDLPIVVDENNFYRNNFSLWRITEAGAAVTRASEDPWRVITLTMWFPSHEGRAYWRIDVLSRLPRVSRIVYHPSQQFSRRTVSGWEEETWVIHDSTTDFCRSRD